MLDEDQYIEVKWYITARINPNELEQGLISDNFRQVIEGDGFGEVIDIEEK